MAGKWIRRSTAVPNLLIDQFMPRLRDTEWRVLVVIVRATLGWIDPLTGHRKEREWISGRQFRSRTGRASEAVSRALDNLTKAGLIVITDTSNRALESPSERRRARSRFRYGLHPNILRATIS